MPTCEPCERHWTPSSMAPDGSCPTCGTILTRPPLAERAGALAGRRGGDEPVLADGDPGDPGDPGDQRPVRAPWHFKLLLGALVGYLGWRAFQGVEWVVHHL